MATIAVDGLDEEEFRRSIEQSLREGDAATAVERLRVLLARYAGPGRVLPARFLTVVSTDLGLTGWEMLGHAIRRHDKPGRPVTALSIAFGWPGEEVPQPDAAGRLRPWLETGYFTDDAYPFSKSGRDDLLDGYSRYGCAWSADCEATDTALTLDGIDDLHGSLAALEARLLASDAPDEDEILAGSLAACLLSVLLFQAVGERIVRDGLPRGLCVTSGSSGVYPYFDAPVVGMSDAALAAAEAQAEADAANATIPVPRYSSLLMTGIPRAKKRAVLALDESEDEMANRLAKLRGLHHAEEETALDSGEAAAPNLPEVTIIPMPDGPLLAKKPSGQSWDFRDLLAPREPGTPVAEPPLEPSESPLPVARFERPAEPGFTLLESDVQERLQSLVAPFAPHSMPQPDLAEPETASASPRPIRLGYPDVQADVEQPLAEEALQSPTAGSVAYRIWAWVSQKLRR